MGCDMPFILSSDFIGDFKVGDNLVYGFEILTELYNCSVDNDNASLLIKPILLIQVSIIEAMLDDLINMRVQNFTREGVGEIEEATLARIRKITTDKLAVCIAQCRKHELIGGRESEYYQHLDSLRKIRNRLHIQNNLGHTPRDEADLFTAEVKHLSERTLEYVALQLHLRYQRPIGCRCVSDFEVPWDRHIDE